MCAETCTHSANCAADVGILQVPFLGLVLDMLVVMHRQVRGLTSV